LLLLGALAAVGARLLAHALHLFWVGWRPLASISSSRLSSPARARMAASSFFGLGREGLVRRDEGRAAGAKEKREELFNKG